VTKGSDLLVAALENEGVACKARSSGQFSNSYLFHPTHNPRPIFFKRPFPHEQA
jgi:hypothetical protein